MNRPLSRFYGQLIWLLASALFVSVLFHATAPDRPSAPWGYAARAGR